MHLRSLAEALEILARCWSQLLCVCRDVLNSPLNNLSHFRKSECEYQQRGNSSWSFRWRGEAHISQTMLPFIPFHRVKMWVAVHWIFSHTGSSFNPSNYWLWNIQTFPLWGRSRNTAGTSTADWVNIPLAHAGTLHSPFMLTRLTLMDTLHAFQACNYGADS